MWGSWVDYASMQEADAIAIAMVVRALISLYNQVDALIEDSKVKDQVQAWELQADLRSLPAEIAEVLPALNSGNSHFDRNFFRVLQLMCKVLEEARDALDDHLLASVSILHSRTLNRRLQAARNKIRHTVSLYNTYCSIQHLSSSSSSSQRDPENLDEPLQKLIETLQQLESTIGSNSKPCPRRILKLVAKMRSNRHHPVETLTMEELDHFCRVGGVEALVQLLSSPSQAIQTQAMVNLESLSTNYRTRAKICLTPGALEQLATTVASTNGEVQHMAVGILRILLQSNDQIDVTRILFPGIVVRLLQLLRISSPRVKANASGVLWELSLGADNRMKIGAAPGAVELLVRLFRAPSPTLQFCMAATLCNICVHKSLRTKALNLPGVPYRLVVLLHGSFQESSWPHDVPFGQIIGRQELQERQEKSGSAPNENTGPSPGALGWSVAMLDSDLEHHQLRALSFLLKYEFPETLTKVAVQQGVLSRLVKLLRSPSLLVQERAADTLWKFSVPDENELKIAEVRGAIERLLELLDSKSVGVRENACKVLESLSYNRLNRSRITSKKGAIEKLSALLFLNSYTVQANAASALWNLANTTTVNKVEVAKAEGTLERLVQLLDSNSSLVQEKAAGALMNLSYDAENRFRISAIPTAHAKFVALLQSSSTLVHQNAAGGLFNLSVDKCIARSIACTPMAVPNLVVLLSSLSNIVQEYVAGAIANISVTSEETRKLCRQMGALPMLRQLKTSTCMPVRAQAKRALDLFGYEP